jgi:biopolymer transport protein ExbD
MSLLKKRASSREIEIPTSSMADIAFLLLVFFLLVTTIDVDTGIYMELPPPLEEDQEPPEIPSRNILMVLVNAQGDVLIDGEFVGVRDIRPLVKRFVTNEGRDPRLSDSPDKAIVSFKTERRAQYEMYIRVLDEIKMAYTEIRNEFARDQFGAPDYATYRANLGPGDFDQVRDRYKQRISIAEPDPGE